jgi:hypothetical protein
LLEIIGGYGKPPYEMHAHKGLDYRRYEHEGFDYWWMAAMESRPTKYTPTWS